MTLFQGEMVALGMKTRAYQCGYRQQWARTSAPITPRQTFADKTWQHTVTFPWLRNLKPTSAPVLHRDTLSMFRHDPNGSHKPILHAPTPVPTPARALSTDYRYPPRGSSTIISHIPARPERHGPKGGRNQYYKSRILQNKRDKQRRTTVL
jgi:hypothetical protein